MSVSYILCLNLLINIQIKTYSVDSDKPIKINVSFVIINIVLINILSYFIFLVNRKTKKVEQFVVHHKYKKNPNTVKVHCQNYTQ